MRSRTWLVVGLVCALGGSLAAQPAQPAAPGAGAPAVPKVPAPKAAPAPKAPKGNAKKGTPAKAEKIDLAPTIATLGTGANDAAAKAAEALGTSTEPAAHEALLDALAFGLPPSVAIAAITALGSHAAPPDVVALVRYAGHHNPNVRGAAFGALAMYPAPVARRALIAGLHDTNATARTAAAMAASKAKAKEAVEPLFQLLGRSDDAAAKALAGMADADLARKIGDQLGKVPDAILATTLGLVLKRADFGPDTARVDLVRAIGKIQDASAISALTDYIDATPKNPPRQSRQEAQKMVEARLGGGK
jgi:HEAT repeat protein